MNESESVKAESQTVIGDWVVIFNAVVQTLIVYQQLHASVRLTAAFLLFISQEIVAKNARCKNGPEYHVA